jgi:hypothetical protein
LLLRSKRWQCRSRWEYREAIQGNNLAQRLFEVLTENVGIAPAWQVQTQLGNMQQMLA